MCLTGCVHLVNTKPYLVRRSTNCSKAFIWLERNITEYSNSLTIYIPGVINYYKYLVSQLVNISNILRNFRVLKPAINFYQHFQTCLKYLPLMSTWKNSRRLV